MLDAPKSRFHLRDWPDEQRWTVANYVREGLVPDARGCGGPPPTTDAPNNLILMLVNLVGWDAGPIHTFTTINFAGVKATEFARSARQSHTSSIPPPPRTLMWVEDVHKFKVIPRTVDKRTKLTTMLEAFAHAEEVAGSNIRSKGAIKRERALDAQSTAFVMQRMRRSGTHNPVARRPFSHEDELGLSATSRTWHQELEDLKVGFENQQISQFAGLPPGPLVGKLRRKDTRSFSPEFKRMATLKAILNGQNSQNEKVSRLLDMQADIDRIDLDLRMENIAESEYFSRRERLESRMKELKQAQNRLSTKEFYRFMFLDDDRRAFNMDPPLLSWDRRCAEPLIVHQNEFSRPKELALLDLQTVNERRTIKATTSSQELYYDMIASKLLGINGPTNLKHLDTVGPGAYNALIKSSPSLQDPRKGGRKDIDSVRARTLTAEMLTELAIAWDNWPFKPSLANMLRQTDVADHDTLLRWNGPASRMG